MRPPHRRVPARLRPLLVLAALVVLASPAAATEVLKLKNGDLVPGDVMALDDDSVTFARQAGGKVRVLWSEVLPLSRYELWESTLAADDAAGRVGLAKWAFSEKLFVYARKELLKAQGLGYEPKKNVSALLEEVDRTEADAALGQVDALLEKGDPQGALDQLRRYLRVAPPGEQADRVRGRVPDVLARIERKDALETEREKQEESATKVARRQRWVDQNLAKATKLKQTAIEASIEAYAYLAKGNQTRSRRGLDKAEKGFQKGREIFKRVRRAVGSGETAEICQREMDECDRRTVDLLGRWGKLEVGNKSWKRASAIVDRGLRIDPVNRELLEMRKTIDENWIRRKLSGITNASGRESSN